MVGNFLRQCEKSTLKEDFCVETRCNYESAQLKSFNSMNSPEDFYVIFRCYLYQLTNLTFPYLDSGQNGLSVLQRTLMSFYKKSI